MGELHKSGSMSLRFRALGATNGGSPRDEYLEAVQAAADGDYTVFGEMGRSQDGGVVYLARDLADRRLVALRLAPDPMGGDEFLLDVVKHLEPSLPALESSCPGCHEPIRKWGRFCTCCGTDLSGVEFAGTPDAELMAAVQDASGGDYEVLGEMRHVDGGGLVYFAREKGTRTLIALRLLREGTQEYSVGLTTALKALSDSVDRPGYRPPTPVLPNPPLQHVRPMASAHPPQQMPAIPSEPLVATKVDRVFELLQQPMLQASILVVVVALSIMMCSGRP